MSASLLFRQNPPVQPSASTWQVGLRNGAVTESAHLAYPLMKGDPDVDRPPRLAEGLALEQDGSDAVVTLVVSTAEAIELMNATAESD